MKKIIAVALFIIFVFPVCVFAQKEAAPAAKKAPAVKNVAAQTAKKAPTTPAKNVSVPVEDQFKKSFPKNNFESITSTDVKGVYEVYTGNQIYYYMPKDDVILYGSLINKGGINIPVKVS